MVADGASGVDLGIDGIGPAEHIGRGGFADVYRAEQLSLRRTVAVKVLRAQASDPEADARFQRECHAIGAVSDHPNIIAVHHSGLNSNGRAYLVMEYLPGGSLAQLLERQGPRPIREVVETTIKIARALAVAHRAGILHRDVKPGNIMISAYGEPALGDFGIARIEGGHQTATGQVTASIVHAAPEVLEGHQPTMAADIYSLGSTLFELAVGWAPYQGPPGESVWPVMKRILSEPMPTPASVGLSPALGAVFQQATARNPAERYHDADEMADDLLRLLEDPAALATLPPDPTVPLPIDLDRTAVVEPMPQTVAAPGTAPPLRSDLTAVPAPSAANRSASLDGSAPRIRPAPGSAGGVIGVALASLASLAAVGAVAWFLLVPAIDDRSTSTDGPTGAVPLVVEGAADGPLDEGRSYAMTVPDQPIDASYRLVLDGQPTGPATATVPPLVAPVGRHRVAVEITTGNGVELTETVDIIAVAADLEPGFRAHLARLPAAAERWSEVVGIVDALEADGHRDLEVVPSSGLAGIGDGVWLVTVPGFADGAQAEDYCDRFELSIPDRCYAAPVVPVGS